MHLFCREKFGIKRDNHRMTLLLGKKMANKIHFTVKNFDNIFMLPWQRTPLLLRYQFRGMNDKKLCFRHSLHIEKKY